MILPIRGDKVSSRSSIDWKMEGFFLQIFPTRCFNLSCTYTNSWIGFKFVKNWLQCHPQFSSTSSLRMLSWSFIISFVWNDKWKKIQKQEEVFQDSHSSSKIGSKWSVDSGEKTTIKSSLWRMHHVILIQSCVVDKTRMTLCQVFRFSILPKQNYKMTHFTLDVVYISSYFSFNWSVQLFVVWLDIKIPFLKLFCIIFCLMTFRIDKNKLFEKLILIAYETNATDICEINIRQNTDCFFQILTYIWSFCSIWNRYYWSIYANFVTHQASFLSSVVRCVIRNIPSISLIKLSKIGIFQKQSKTNMILYHCTT